MKPIPFSVYDFFGYLAPGFLLLVFLGFLSPINTAIHEHLYHVPRASVNDQHLLEETVEQTAQIQAAIHRQMIQPNPPDALLKLQQALENNYRLHRELADKIQAQQVPLDHFLLKKEMGFPLYLLWIGVAYVLGHFLASLSAKCLEDYLVKKRLMIPTVNFFHSWPRKLPFFKSYNHQLPEPIRKKIIKRFEKEIKKGDADQEQWNFLMNPKKTANPIPKKKKERKEWVEQLRELAKAIVYHAYNAVKTNEGALTLHDRFVELYGFSRNVSFICIFCLCLMLFYIVVGVIGGLPLPTWRGLVTFAFLFIVLGYVLLSCYLKFYRLRFREIILAYYSSHRPKDSKTVTMKFSSEHLNVTINKEK